MSSGKKDVKSYKDLVVWQASVKMATEVYALTKKLPREEVYGLSSQLQRAAVSVPSNIAEGSSRQNTKEFVQFLYIAKGSLSEVETQLEITRNVYRVEGKELESHIIEIHKMLSAIIRQLKTKL